MLKLYTNISFLTDANRSKVFPLLFDLHYVKSEQLCDFYELTDTISDCDIVVLPIDYGSFFKNQKAFQRLLTEAQKYKKPIWLYTAGDFGFTVHIPNSYNFRLGGFHSKLSDNTFVMPSFINDPFETALKTSFSVLRKTEQPRIGFVGHAKTGIIKYMKSYLSHFKLRFKYIVKSTYFDKQSFYPSGIKRAQYLNTLKRSENLQTNFILRNNYRAGAKDQKAKARTTTEFYNNIFDNLYTFCIRGVGNFSVRFYETLAVGRIPILLNTDCRLPLSNLIDWNKHTVILDASSKVSLEQQILQFHEAKSNEELAEIQKNNRLLWETHLRRHSYFIKVHDIFVEQLKLEHA
ncbi:exostosin domain-containing protein [Tamlana crocina]|uniref:Exostosin family protein n=1 Tax=Tamlana crocina TaxID=393006 RepID=A0ABX1D9J8_9FLAO|nr:exostosin family protein [Tamlana crocina]